MRNGKRRPKLVCDGSEIRGRGRGLLVAKTTRIQHGIDRSRFHLPPLHPSVHQQQLPKLQTGEREHVTAVFHLGPSLFGFSASFHPNPANCSDSSIEEPPLLFSSLSLSLPYTLYRRRRHNEHSSRLGGHRKRRRPLPPIGKGSPLLFAFVYKRIRRRREPIPSPCTCRCAKSDLPLIPPPPPPQRPGESNIQMRRANL